MRGQLWEKTCVTVRHGKQPILAGDLYMASASASGRRADLSRRSLALRSTDTEAGMQLGDETPHGRVCSCLKHTVRSSFLQTPWLQQHSHSRPHLEGCLLEERRCMELACTSSLARSEYHTYKHMALELFRSIPRHTRGRMLHRASGLQAQRIPTIQTTKRHGQVLSGLQDLPIAGAPNSRARTRVKTTPSGGETCIISH